MATKPSSLKNKSRQTKEDRSDLGNKTDARLGNKIDETDEMKLKLLEGMGKTDAEDMLYPPELNAHLLEQLKIMTCENNELRKCVFTKDQEMKELNKTVTDLNQRIRDIITGTGPQISSKSAGIISAKISELCKQNRHLVAELEGYKTKNASLERKVMQLEILNKEHEKVDVCACKNETVESSPDELKELNNKLAVVNKRLYESKNKNLELKNDILLATKILQQELGEKFSSIKDLQNDLAGWKGRAQQIHNLQAKINELEEKLGKQKDNTENCFKGNQTLLIKELELKKKREVEQAMKNLEILKAENLDYKKKIDGAKCRIRNLECEATTVRQKIQTLIEKSEHDDMLINEQRNQIKTLELYYQEILKENTGKMNKMHSEIVEYQKLVQNTETKIDALRKQATEKAVKIEELRAQLLRYEECSLQSVFFTPMKTATDNEIKKLSELVVTLNERLHTERRKWDDLEAAHQKTKEKKKRLDRKVTTLEEELKALRDAKKGSRASRSSIIRDTSENGISYGGNIGKRSSSIVAERHTVVANEFILEDEVTDKDDLKFRLELAQEKLKIMEDKLKMLEEEKSEDFKHLTEMIQTSKQLFHEALAVLQKEKCVCN